MGAGERIYTKAQGCISSVEKRGIILLINRWNTKKYVKIRETTHSILNGMTIPNEINKFLIIFLLFVECSEWKDDNVTDDGVGTGIGVEMDKSGWADRNILTCESKASGCGGVRNEMAKRKEGFGRSNK